MELYIEKEFLDNFYIEYCDSYVQKKMKSIFIEYGSKSIFMDFSAPNIEDFEKLQLENEYFALMCSANIPPIPVESIKKHLFEKSNLNQTMVFMDKSQDWFDEAEKKGVLCFSFENYESKIENIEKQCNVKIDLSEGFKGWSQLNFIKLLPSNEIIVADNYILSDNQKIDDNIIPFLENIINDSTSINVNLLTKNFQVRQNTPEKVKEKVISIHEKLKRIFASKPIKFKITSTDKSSGYKIEIHDRRVLSNFYIIECGKGFNLMPHKENDSVLTSETIFDKFTYKRHNNLRKIYIGLEDHLKKIDSYNFKYYPE